MPLRPKIADVARIRSALAFYRVSSFITGTFLLLLVGEVILKFGLGYELDLGGNNGVLALAPWSPLVGTSTTGFNLSTGILIAHGWFYVVYLFADFRIWSLMRWPFPRFVLIALGGVVPFLSFIVERRIHARVTRELAELHATTEAANA